MAKKKSNLPLLAAGAAAVGAGVYFLSKRKGATPTTNETTPSTNPSAVVTPSTNDPYKSTAFMNAVREIQTWLGVGVDGDPGKTSGSQTNKALAAKLPAAYNLLGPLSPSNLSKYNDYIAVAQKNEATTKTTLSIYNYINGGKSASLKSKTGAGFMTFNAYTFDKIRKVWNKGQIVTAKNGQLLNKINYKGRSATMLYFQVPVYGQTNVLGNRSIIGTAIIGVPPAYIVSA